MANPFDLLIGEWDVEVPAFGGHGRLMVEPLGEFVVQRSIVDDPYPSSVSILGDGLMHYFDSRGVTRLYETTLADGVWKIWRHDPDDFSQRFTGTISDDGQTITAAWEKCMDGAIWELDFEVTYTRVSSR